MKLKRLCTTFITVYITMCWLPDSMAQMPHYLRPEYRNANSNWIFGRCYTADGMVDYAQPDNDSAMHINFNTTPPTVTRKHFWEPKNNPGMRQATLAVSDPADGKLLFYTEGMHVRNRNQVIMPNGSGLRGDDWLTPQGYYNSVMRQGFCAVPVLGSNTKWYLFTLTSANTNTLRFESKLFYSIIDMSLDNGNGDINPTEKNIPLDTLNTMFGEAITAIPGNNCDLWLLTYDRRAVAYKTYHITEQGVEKTPVVSPSISTLDANSFLQGTFSFSPDRSKISLAYNYNDVILGRPKRGCIIAKFDLATGKVSDEIRITSADGGYASAFSDNNQYLYLGSLITGNANSLLTQYNLSVWDSATIRQSRYVLDSTFGFGGYSWGIRRRDSQLLVIGGGMVGVIMKPDLPGASCDLRESYFRTVGVTGARDTVVNSLSIGNDVILPLYEPIAVRRVDTFICSGYTLPLSPTFSSGSDYTWDDGSTDSMRLVIAPGKYWVNYREHACRTRADTFIVEEVDLEPSITISGYTLGTSTAYTTYQWLRNGQPLPGATERNYQVTENGDYTVIVSGQNGCLDTSDIYTVNSLNIDQLLSSQALVRVYPNPATDIIYFTAPVALHACLKTIDGRILLKKRNVNYLAIGDLPIGIYLLELNSADERSRVVEKIIKQ